MTTHNAGAETLGPPRVVEALKSQTSERYSFVIGFSPDQAPSPLPAETADEKDLPLINAKAASLIVADAFSLAERADVDWVWYLHPDEAPTTIRTLLGLEYSVDNLEPPNLVNLSIGPPSSFYRREPEPAHPVSRAVTAAAERGFITVVAVGNTGRSAPGYVNPWSIPAEVISVGAWDHNTGRPWAGSSTGNPEHPETWPDVIAPGVDVIGPWSGSRKKPAERRTYDESHASFRERVPEEDWDKYTMMTGTSQAAAVVSGAAAQLLRYLLGFIEERERGPGDMLFSLEADADRISEHDHQAARLTGNAIPTGNGGTTYEYWLDTPYKLIKQILMDTAIPVTGAEPWEAGAGLVDPEYIRKQFGAYGVESPGILPVKVK